MRLRDEVAIITGSTRGLGRAIALMYAREGASVVVTGRTRDAGEEVVRTIRDAGGAAIYQPMDVSREEDVQAAVAAATRAFGKLTILVNNAAPMDLITFQDGKTTEVAGEIWQQILETGLTGVFWACKHAVPAIAGAGGGAIINISSGASLRGMAGMAAYTAVKSAINGLTRALAVDHARERIRANTLVVGFVPPPELVAMPDGPFAKIADRVLDMQLTRIGVPDDVAYACVYLGSKESEFVTGAIIPVDGGFDCRSGVDLRAMFS